MNGHGKRKQFLSLGVAALLISACATSNQTTTSKDSSATGQSGFNNILVVGVANDYEGRTQFERKLARDLSAGGLTATAMYSVGGGNKPVTRESIQSLVDNKGYDAVLISRVIARDTETSVKAGSAATKAVRRNNRPVDLFRYDYEELNEPETIEFELGASLVTELFAAADSQSLWRLESTISKKKMLEELINEASEKIVRGLKRDSLID